MALEILEVVAILGTRSFTIPIHTNYGHYPYGYGYGSYDQPVYQGSGGYTDSLIGRSPAPSGSCRVLSWCDRWREWQRNAEVDP